MIAVYWVLGVLVYMMIGKGIYTFVERRGVWDGDRGLRAFYRVVLGGAWPYVLACLLLVLVLTLLWNTPEGLVKVYRCLRKPVAE